jgi:hypothetical protein
MCAVMVAGLIGCSHEQPAPQTAAAAGQGQGGAAPGSYEPYQTASGPQVSQAPSSIDQACPMQVPGTRAVVAAVDGGVALDLTTTTGDVVDLRARVKAIAGEESSGTAIAQPAAGGAQQGSGGREMHDEVTHIGTRARVQDLPTGARIVFMPVDPGQLGALRAQTDAMATRLNQGDCSQLEAYGVQLSGPNNGARKANRTPPLPPQPAPLPNPLPPEGAYPLPPGPGSNELPPPRP